MTITVHRARASPHLVRFAHARPFVAVIGFQTVAVLIACLAARRLGQATPGEAVVESSAFLVHRACRASFAVGLANGPDPVAVIGLQAVPVSVARTALPPARLALSPFEAPVTEICLGAIVVHQAGVAHDSIGHTLRLFFETMEALQAMLIRQAILTLRPRVHTELGLAHQPDPTVGGRPARTSDLCVGHTLPHHLVAVQSGRALAVMGAFGVRHAQCSALPLVQVAEVIGAAV